MAYLNCSLWTDKGKGFRHDKPIRAYGEGRVEPIGLKSSCAKRNGRQKGGRPIRGGLRKKTLKSSEQPKADSETESLN